MDSYIPEPEVDQSVLCCAQVLRRSASAEVKFAKESGKALAAHLDKVALDEVQRAAVLEHGKPPPTPAEQLALLRAEQGTKRPGVGQ